MRYHLKIDRVETNEQYDAELKEWNERSKYSHMHSASPFMNAPQPERSIVALEVILTDIEFSHLKRHIMEIFQ